MKPGQYFLECAGRAQPGLASAAKLDALLDELADTGRVAWPQVSLAPEAFLRHLARGLPADADPLAFLRTVHAADLYLACACALAEPHALAAFDEKFISGVSRYLARADALSGFTDEVKQEMRTHLLMSKRGLLPSITAYSGRGPLGGWLRMVTARAAVDVRRERQRKSLEGHRHLMVEAPVQDLELGYLKARYRKKFEEAFGAALVSLAARDANILHLYFLEGMTAEAIGRTYKVSGRTVQRWMADARHQLLDETRHALHARLGLSPAEFESLWGVVKSEVDLSIYRLLKKTADK